MCHLSLKVIWVVLEGAALLLEEAFVAWGITQSWFMVADSVEHTTFSSFYLYPAVSFLEKCDLQCKQGYTVLSPLISMIYKTTQFGITLLAQ